EVVPNDGPVLEARFDGSIDISPALNIPTIVAVSPEFGSLAGGADGLINGYSFPAGGTRPGHPGKGALVFRPPGAQQVVRKADLIAASPPTDNLIQFKVPSAGLSSPSLFATKFDVEVQTPNGRSIKPDGFQYEYLRVTSADRSSGSVLGGDLMTIN